MRRWPSFFGRYRPSPGAVAALAFGILVAWSLFAYTTMQSLILSQNIYGRLINTSGKQRMYSQRAALYALLAADAKEKSTTARHLRRLREMADQMARDHRYILQHLPDEKLRRLYLAPGGLDAEVHSFLKKIEAFLQNPRSPAPIVTGSERLLGSLNRAVNAFEEASDTRIATLRRRQQLILAGSLVTLILIALFLIRPMLRAQKEYTVRLENEIRKQVRDIKILAKIFEHSREGMIVTDHNERILNVNNAFTDITGYSREEALGKTPKLLRSNHHDHAFYRRMWQELREQGYWRGHIVNRRKNGELVHEDLSIMKIVDDESGESFFVSVFSDITERIMHERHLEYMATHDELTGLPNRTQLLKRIDEAMAEASRSGDTLALLFIDLDNFKLVNDSVGHIKADRYIVETARRLASELSGQELLARVGGDEFVILMPHIPSASRLAERIEAIRQRLNAPLRIENRTFIPLASIGVVLFNPRTDAYLMENSRTLIRKADLAMYRAKEEGKNRVAYYSQRLDERLQTRLLVETQLREALDKGEIAVYLQPKVAMSDGRPVGAEALIRWQKGGETISPAAFIPIAEETGLIQKLDRYVVTEALKILKKWQERGWHTFTIAVNISARTFADAETFREIVDLIEASGLARCVEIEMTEGVFLGNLDEASSRLATIHERGIRLALDDFGTGYSSFSYLSRLPFDTLKIDRTFVMQMEEPRQKILIEAMIDFSEKLGMKLVAEGIETDPQRRWLMERGCPVAQGYLFAPPLTPEAFSAYVQRFAAA